MFSSLVSFLYIGQRAQEVREYEAARIAQEEAVVLAEEKGITEKEALPEVIAKTAGEWGLEAGAIQRQVDIQTRKPRTYGGTAAGQPTHTVAVPKVKGSAEVVYKRPEDVTEADVQKIRYEALPVTQQAKVSLFERQKKDVEIGAAGEVILREEGRKKVITVGGATADVPESATVFPGALQMEYEKRPAKAIPAIQTPEEVFLARAKGEPYQAIPGAPESIFLVEKELKEPAFKPSLYTIEAAKGLGVSPLPKAEKRFESTERIGVTSPGLKEFVTGAVIGTSLVKEQWRTIVPREIGTGAVFGAAAVVIPRITGVAGVGFAGKFLWDIGRAERPLYELGAAVPRVALQALGGAPTLKVGVKLKTRAALKQALKTEVAKLPKAERVQFKQWMETTEVIKGIRPTVKPLKTISVERVPTKAMPAITELARMRQDIIGGTVAAKAQIYGAKLKPADIDVYVKKSPVIAAQEYAAVLKKAKVERVSIVGKEVTVKGKKAIEFHLAKEYFDPNIAQVGRVFEKGVIKAPEGVRLMKVSLQAKRKLVGAFVGGRAYKDVPHFMEIMKSTLKTAEIQAQQKWLFREARVAEIQKARARVFGYKYAPKETPSIMGAMLKSKRAEVGFVFKKPKVLKTPSVSQFVRGGRGYPRYPKISYPTYPKITYPKYPRVGYPKRAYSPYTRPTIITKAYPVTKPYKPYKPIPYIRPYAPYKPTRYPGRAYSPYTRPTIITKAYPVTKPYKPGKPVPYPKAPYKPTYPKLVKPSPYPEIYKPTKYLPTKPTAYAFYPKYLAMPIEKPKKRYWLDIEDVTKKEIKKTKGLWDISTVYKPSLVGKARYEMFGEVIKKAPKGIVGVGLRPMTKKHVQMLKKLTKPMVM